MIVYFYISIAAIFNAVMDTLWTKFPVSVFKDFNSRWWNPNESWKHYPNFLGIVRLDAWHLAKYGMLGGMTGAIVSYTEYHLYDWILIPIVWSISFELFYSLILKSKTT
jgi:hypothetical protein